MNPQSTGNLISKIRKEINLTQKDLADKLNVTPKAISRWETGRGYPDIEILPDLSKALNITINELLNGELSPNNDDINTKESNLIYICNNAAQSKKRDAKKIICLSVVLGVATLFLLMNIFFILSSSISIINSIDPNCVIAYDYSYIIYNKEKYLPIDAKGYTFHDKDIIVEEATIQGQSKLDKLFFGDRIYSVTGTENNEVIHLDTDYDFAPSEFYAKKSEIKNIYNKMDNFKEDDIYVSYYSFFDEELINTDTLTDKEFLEMVFNLPDTTSPESYCDYDDCVTILTGNENNFVFKEKGDIIRKDHKYYWVEFDIHSLDENYDENYKMQNTKIYPIDTKYYSEIEPLFLVFNK